VRKGLEHIGNGTTRRRSGQLTGVWPKALWIRGNALAAPFVTPIREV
jgi:hypothetical protein